MVECDFRQARSVLQEALETAREIGDEQGVVDALTNLGSIFLSQGDFSNAAKSLEESIEKARELGLKGNIAYNLISLGDLQLAQDDLATAEKSYQEAMTIRTSRVPVTALIAWPRFDSQRTEPQGAKQMAAPAVTRTPNLHRAKTNRSPRVRMEAWRQWQTRQGSKNDVSPSQNRINLTPTGLLMEGDFTDQFACPPRSQLGFAKHSVLPSLDDRPAGLQIRTWSRSPEKSACKIHFRPWG